MGLMTLFVILKQHCNHTGAEVLMVLYPLSAAAIASIVALIIKGKAAWLALALNILAVIFFISIDRYNIMVQYDRWLERGMPDHFEIHRQY